MQRRTRVLVVLPLYGGSLTVGRSCLRALGEIGCLAEAFEAPVFQSSYEGLKSLKLSTDRLEYLENSFLQVVSQAVLAKVESFQPDLVLAMAQAPLSRQALKRLRKDGVPTAMWFVEDYRIFGYWQAFAPLYDLFAVIQKEPLLSELAAVGQPNALYLPLAAEPDFHKPQELTAAERRRFGSDVSFLGAGYPNRRLAFHRLTRFDLKIWGTDWDGDALLAPFVQEGGRRIAPEEYVKIFSASRVNLNLHSSIRAEELVPAGDFVNPRTFELAACGAFQLVDRRGLMPELFTVEGGAADELVTFRDMAELEAKLGYFLDHPEERAAFAARARTRVLAEHTYAARMRALLDFARERLPGFGAGTGRKSAGLDGLPEELRRELPALLDRLGLPQDAAFDDVVLRLRERSDVLSPLETAILFLDEWRRQYGAVG